MKLIRKIALAVIWLLCSYFAHGLMLGSLTAEFPYFRHEPSSAVFSLLGPFALAAALVEGAPSYPYRQTQLNKEERWAYFHAEFPHITRFYFETIDTQ